MVGECPKVVRVRTRIRAVCASPVAGGAALSDALA